MDVMLVVENNDDADDDDDDDDYDEYGVGFIAFRIFSPNFYHISNIVRSAAAFFLLCETLSTTLLSTIPALPICAMSRICERKKKQSISDNKMSECIFVYIGYGNRQVGKE